MADLRVGAASVVITPPIGTHLEGYGGRVGGSIGLHDDLHARAIVFDDGTTEAAIVSCDLIGIDRHTTAAVRELVAAATDIPLAHVMVCATHTHAGPTGMHRRDDEALRDVQNRLIAGAVKQAWRAKKPAVLKAGLGSVDSVSQNRREPGGPTDTSLRVLLADSSVRGEPPIASLINFACHATVLYSTNMEISADYPGYAVRVVEHLTRAPSIFVQGACADVNPVWTVQDFAETERVGTIVGSEASRRIHELLPAGRGEHVWNIKWDEVLDVSAKTGGLVNPAISVASRQVDVRLRTLPPSETYDAKLQQLERQHGQLDPEDVDGRRRIMAQITCLRGERATSQSLHGPAELHPEVQAIALGRDCVILALPGEFFVETAQAIRDSVGIRHLFIACYANHHVMYVPPAHEFAIGGYEPGVAILAEDAESIFRTAAIDLLREVVN